MTALKFSVVIPYKQRLENITTVFASLADQTMDSSQFEVVVGALEYSEEYVAVCREFTDRLSIVSVLSAAPWNVSHARNLAMRQATGQVILVLDADMVCPAGLLDGLYDRYFAQQQNVCVLGQALGYTCVVQDVGGAGGPTIAVVEKTVAGVDSAAAMPYSHYRDLLANLEAMNLVWADERTLLDEVALPWTLCWSGLVALPTATVREHDLTFDEGFRGWGSEDQEWGYRIQASGTPIVLGKDVYAMHLPHARDVVTNQESYRVNSRYFLAKWPSLEVEASRAFGWEEANRTYPDLTGELAAAVTDPNHRLGVVRGKADGTDLLVVGARIDADGQAADPAILALFDDGSALEVLPLAGLALPYPDKSVDECRILPPIPLLSERYREIVLREAERVAGNVVRPALDGA